MVSLALNIIPINLLINLADWGLVGRNIVLIPSKNVFHCLGIWDYLGTHHNSIYTLGAQLGWVAFNTVICLCLDDELINCLLAKLIMYLLL